MSYSPLFPTQLTDLCDILSPNVKQYKPTHLCARLEIKMMDCLEAYGVNRMKEKCADLLYDMIECDSNIFQRKRVDAIRKERMRQYRAGLLDKPFDEYPPIDGYLYMSK